MSEAFLLSQLLDPRGQLTQASSACSSSRGVRIISVHRSKPSHSSIFDPPSSKSSLSSCLTTLGPFRPLRHAFVGLPIMARRKPVCCKKCGVTHVDEEGQRCVECVDLFGVTSEHLAATKRAAGLKIVSGDVLTSVIAVLTFSGIRRNGRKKENGLLI